eukprot:XP_024443713.1 uncharacterized protein LOC112324533 [Populus trichocarpa]
MHDLRKNHKFQIGAVAEPRVSGFRADKIIEKLKFESSFRVEAQGMSGGLWLMWNNSNVNVKILNSSRHFIHGSVDKGSSEAWLFTVVYANPNAILKKQCFEEVANLARNVRLPWMVIGDFNEILMATEKSGGVGVDNRRIHRFAKWVQECKLIDLGSKGPKYTWRGGIRNGYMRVQERLDRCFGNAQWRQLFQDANVLVLPRVRSDHHLILVELKEQRVTVQGEGRPFRFEAAWLQHREFAEFLKNQWETDAEVPTTLEGLMVQLKIWNKWVYGNIFQKKRKVLARLGGIQKAIAVRGNPHLYQLEDDLSAEYNEILRQEEIHWFQKSRCNWISFGDRNTSYFHTKTIIRRQRNKIKALKNELQVWVWEENKLKDMAREFYQKLFWQDQEETREDIRLEGNFPIIDQNHINQLEAPILDDEIKAAIFGMKPYKAPGPDGYQPIFYQSQWHVIGQSFCRYVRDIFTSNKDMSRINHSYLVLIPKVQMPEYLHQFRPIGLCNVILKALSKVIVGRLQALMPNLISEVQSNFVPGRQITDNIIVAQEVIHSMRKMKGKKGFMTIKVDLEKAYDILSWKFIRETLIDARLPSDLIRVIMQSIETQTLSVLWNGSATQKFSPNRDDMLLFTEASMDQLERVTKCLDTFCAASGQKENHLWVKVLKDKYMSTRRREGNPVAIPSDSVLWKAICKEWDTVNQNATWNVGNGKQILFWRDSWLESYGPIINHLEREVQVDTLDYTVADMVDDRGNWKWDVFAHLIPMQIVMSIVGYTPPMQDGIDDTVGWDHSSNGKLTVRTAYMVLEERGEMDQDPIWRLIRKWQGMERIKVFLWTVAHNSIMTNDLRYRRHLTANRFCDHCGTEVETLTHALRDCPKARKIWEVFVKVENRELFFSQNWYAWLVSNMSARNRNTDHGAWSLEFGIALWYIWKERCNRVFGVDQGNWFRAILAIKRMVRDTEFTQRHGNDEGRSSKEDTQVGWKYPQEERIKLNVDGCSKGNPGVAGAGGVIRDHLGVWIGGFARNIGICSSVNAELWAVYVGLQLAWDRGFRKVDLESDSKVVVGLINGDSVRVDRNYNIIMQIIGMLGRDWEVTTYHVYREANCVADWLANYGLTRDLLDRGSDVLEEPPSGLYPLLYYDLIGSTVTRSI